jgi:hypothetical protein
MVITIHFQSEQDLQWLGKIVEMLKKAAVQFEVQGPSPEKSPGLRQRRQAFLNAVHSGRVITTPIVIPNREERNAR